MLAAEGRLAPANPNLFSLRAGRLYLFRSDRARARFLADASIAAKAEAQWPALKGGLLQP